MGKWDKWNFWDGITWKKPVTEFKRISLCTTVMNRLHTLKEVLPKNIEDNLDYPNVEFLILDYNSTDGLEDWMRDNMVSHMATGLVRYVRTTDPEFYSMTHSRNLAFKCATGEIVNNVDADNYVNKSFASFLNMLAHEQPSNAVFCKGKRMMHGRCGFYKDDFINLLGGYDEDIEGYGHDDHDLVERAMLQKFKMMWYGSRFCERIKTSGKEKTVNMKNKNWKETETINKKISADKIEKGILKANEGKIWGSANVTVNFIKEMLIK